MKFEPGKTYSCRSIGDSECIHSLTVVSRTAKTIRTEVFGKPKTLRIFDDYGGAEAVRPHGNYSMAAVIRATKGV